MTAPARSPRHLRAVADAPATPPSLEPALDPAVDELEHVLDKLGPNELSLRYERDLLHVLLWEDPDGAIARAVRPVVDAADFWGPDHGKVYRAALWLLDRHGFVDYRLLRERAVAQGEKGVVEALSQITAVGDGMPFRAVFYARQIRQRAVLRGLAELDVERVRARARGLADTAALVAALDAARTAELALLARLPTE